MKVTQEHYELIKEQLSKGIDGVMAKNPHMKSRKDFFDEWEKVYIHYTEQHTIWDLYWACNGNDWKSIAFDGDPYGGDYNETHMDTALKKVYKELNK